MQKLQLRPIGVRTSLEWLKSESASEQTPMRQLAINDEGRVAREMERLPLR